MGEENLEKKKALEIALSQIEKQFGKGSVMKLGEYKAMNIEAIPTRGIRIRYSTRNWWSSKRKNNRNFWTRIFWKNNTSFTYNCRSTKNEWRSSIYRCRACS